MGFASLNPSTALRAVPPPRSSQHPQPISEAQFLDQRLAEAALAHRLHQILQSRSIAEFRRNHGAVEIGAKSNSVLARMFEHVLDMLDDQLRRRVLIVTTIGPKEARGKIDADQAAGFANGRQRCV